MTVSLARTPVGRIYRPQRFRVFVLSPGDDRTEPVDWASWLVLGVNGPADYLGLVVTEQLSGTISGTQDQTTGATNYNQSLTKLKTFTNVAGIFETHIYYDGDLFRSLLLPPNPDLWLPVPANVDLLRVNYVSASASDLQLFVYLYGGE